MLLRMFSETTDQIMTNDGSYDSSTYGPHTEIGLIMVWPTAPTPGTKRCPPCASWSPWEALTGPNGVSLDLLVPWDEWNFIGWDVLPTAQTLGTRGCLECASWSFWEALRGLNGVLLDFSDWDFQKEFLSYEDYFHNDPEQRSGIPLVCSIFVSLT